MEQRETHYFRKRTPPALIKRKDNPDGFLSHYLSLRRRRFLLSSRGRLFFGAEGNSLFPQTDTPCPDQTRKTTLTVFFHTIFPSVAAGFCSPPVGISFFGAEGNTSFPQTDTPCSDQTRKTTLMVFFHTIFPSVAAGFFAPGRLFFWSKGEHINSANGQPCVTVTCYTLPG